jgi:hypothetical protein
MFGASSIEQRHVRRRRSMDQSFAFTEHLITQQNSQHNSVLHKGRSAAPPLAAPVVVVVVVAGGLKNSSELLLNHLKFQRLPAPLQSLQDL